MQYVFVYEDDILQFVRHEEGRIAVASRRTLFLNKGKIRVMVLP